MTTSRRIILALAILFFCVPLALRLVGIQAREFENRPLAGRPSLSDGWDVFPKLTQFAVDRLPLREQAVRTHTRVSLDLLDTPPTWRQQLLGGKAASPLSDQVIQAAGGWLLLGQELDRACDPPISRDLAIRRLRELVDLLEDGGRRKVSVIIPPDKTTVYPDRVPKDNPKRSCAERYRARSWPNLEALRDPRIHPLRKPIVEAQANTSELLWQRKDSHWSAFGASLGLQPALDPFGLEVKEGEIVKKPPVTYTGDLTALLGAPAEDKPSTREIERIGQSPPTLPGVTAFVHDSYGIWLTPLLQPFTEKLRDLAWSVAPPDEIVAGIEGSRQVILEVVERELDTAFSDDGELTALANALRQTQRR